MSEQNQTMYDARIFLNNLDIARDILNKHNAIFKGDYEVHDYIYASNEPNVNLSDCFLRLRVVPKNIWPDKQVIVAIKQTQIEEVGKQSFIPLKKQFDTEPEARAFIDAEYSHSFKPSYDFNRIGWQYFIGEDGIDLEDIEGYYSIEFKSKTKEGLKNLLNLFKVDLKDIIQGPSVVAVKEKLGK